MKKNKGRPSRVVTEQRRQEAIRLLGKGQTQIEVARRLGITPVAVCKNLKTLRAKMATATAREFEVYRSGQLAILETIESALLESKVTPEVAREWRQIRGDIATLLGLNAPTKTVNAKIDLEVDPSKLVGYRRFVHETRYIAESDMEKLWAVCRQLNQLPTATDVRLLTAGGDDEAA